MRLLYLHGFNSSCRSAKATALARWLDPVELVVPELSPYPDVAYAQASALVPRVDAIIGSSLGGFYATALSQSHNKRAVVINPSVRPFELLTDFLGENVNPYTQNKYILEKKHLDYLRSLYKPLRNPDLLFLLQQQGDEVLDWQQAANFYKQSKAIIEPGGDHAFQNLGRFYTAILEFAQ